MNCSLTDEGHARNVRVDAFVAQMQKTERAAVLRAIEHRDMAELERAGIAARIKQARKEAGLSQPEMADALGVIPRTYQNYESAKDPRTPWGLMNDIATVTGKSTEWLIHGERTTPDLLDAARADQLDGVSITFAARVDDVEARLDRIEDKVDAVLRLLKRLATAGVPMPEADLARALEGSPPSDPTAQPEQHRLAQGSR